MSNRDGDGARQQDRVNHDRAQVSNPVAYLKGVVVFIALFGISLWGSDFWLNWGNASTGQTVVITVAVILAVSGWFGLYIHFTGENHE